VGGGGTAGAPPRGVTGRGTVGSLPAAADILFETLRPSVHFPAKIRTKCFRVEFCLCHKNVETSFSQITVVNEIFAVRNFAS
jgi:hypothetical protein